MYKIGILDDDLCFAQKFTKRINVLTSDFNVQVFNQIEGMDLSKFDALFIDIELENINMSGFHIANEIKQLVDIPIIFISSHEDYALDGYRYQAFDFLCKGKLDKYLELCLTRLEETLNERKRRLILLDENSIEVKVQISDVEYGYKEGNYVFIMAGDLYHKRTAISQFYELLPTYFFLTTSGYFVNLDYVKSIDRKNYCVVMLNNKMIPISRERIRLFMIALGKRRM